MYDIGQYIHEFKSYQEKNQWRRQPKNYNFRLGEIFFDFGLVWQFLYFAIDLSERWLLLVHHFWND